MSSRTRWLPAIQVVPDQLPVFGTGCELAVPAIWSQSRPAACRQTQSFCRHRGDHGDREKHRAPGVEATAATQRGRAQPPSHTSQSIAKQRRTRHFTAHVESANVLPEGTVEGRLTPWRPSRPGLQRSQPRSTLDLSGRKLRTIPSIPIVTRPGKIFLASPRKAEWRMRTGTGGIK